MPESALRLPLNLVPVTHPKLSYTVGGLTGIQLPDGFTAAAATERVTQSPLNGKSIEIAYIGDPPSPLEQAVLRYLAAEMASPDRAGRQWRAITPLGPGAAAAAGQVILSFDAQLNATVTLVGRGQATGGHTDNPTDQQARDQLSNTFRLGTITGAWQPGELAKVLWALSTLSGAERDALAGVALERNNELPPGRTGRDQDACFHQVTGPLSVDPGTLYLTDGAFARDASGFFGGADGAHASPPSFQTILHEAGHAIDTAPYRRRSRDNAERLLARAGQPVQANQPISIDDVGAARTLDGPAATAGTANLAVNAYNAVDKRETGYQQRIAECRTAGGLLTELAPLLGDALIGKSEPAMKKVQLIQAEQAALAAAFDSLAELINISTAAQYRQLPPDSFTAIAADVQKLNHAPWQAYCTALISWCDIQDRIRQWWLDYGAADGTVASQQRARFLACAQTSNISADLTKYASDSWPDFPDELLCEAFAIWRLDPQAVRRHSQALYNYFEQGSHLAF